MPDSGLAPVPSPTIPAPSARERRRWVSPLLRRILLLNALPPALLAAAMLYLDQYQNGLLAAEVEAMRTQARIYAGALAEAAPRLQDGGARAARAPAAGRPCRAGAGSRAAAAAPAGRSLAQHPGAAVRQYRPRLR